MATTKATLVHFRMSKQSSRRGALNTSLSSDDDDSVERQIVEGGSDDVHVAFIPKCANDIITKKDFTSSTLADLVRLSKEDFRVTAYRGRLPKRLISYHSLKLKSRFEVIPGAKEGVCVLYFFLSIFLFSSSSFFFFIFFFFFFFSSTFSISFYFLSVFFFGLILYIDILTFAFFLDHSCLREVPGTQKRDRQYRTKRRD